jgi:hypothetical protein
MARHAGRGAPRHVRGRPRERGGGVSIPTIVSAEFVADEHDSQGPERTLYLLHYLEAAQIPQLALMISIQRESGHKFGVHHGMNKGALN